MVSSEVGSLANPGLQSTETGLCKHDFLSAWARLVPFRRSGAIRLALGQQEPLR